MEARNGSDPHRSGSNMPKNGETDFPTFQMLLTAFMMRHNGVTRHLKLRYRKTNPRKMLGADWQLMEREIRKPTLILSKLFTIIKQQF